MSSFPDITLPDGRSFKTTKALSRTLRRLEITPERAKDVWLHGEQCDVPVSNKRIIQPEPLKRARADDMYTLVYVETDGLVKGITILYT